MYNDYESSPTLRRYSNAVCPMSPFADAHFSPVLTLAFSRTASCAAQNDGQPSVQIMEVGPYTPLPLRALASHTMVMPGRSRGPGSIIWPKTAASRPLKPMSICISRPIQC